MSTAAAANKWETPEFYARVADEERISAEQERARGEREAKHRAAQQAADKARDEEAQANLAAMEARIGEALEILKHGDPLGYLRDTFSKIHSGDVESIESIALAIACQSIVNSQGIQPGFGGDKGTGKTSSVKAALHCVNPSWILEGSVSDKALFHFLSAPGMIVFSDDVDLNPDVTATIKRAMSNFQSSTKHRTLDRDRKKAVVTIAPRQLFLFTSVNGTGDDQLKDRQFAISYQKSDKANKEFVEFVQDREESGQEELPLLHEVLVSRAIFDEIKNKLFRVIIPFAKNLHFNDPDQRRNVIMVYDFIKAFTVLRFMQRQQSHTDGDPENVITLKSEIEDAQAAIKTYKSMGPQIQALKLSKDELALWDFIYTEQGGEVSFPDLVERYAATEAGKRSATESRIRRLLQGRPERGEGGLVEKVAGLTITHEVREVSNSKKRAVKVIKCIRGPGIEEYAEFVTIDPSLVPCPSPVQDIPKERERKNEPHLEKEDSIDNNNNNNSILSQEKGRSIHKGDHGAQKGSKVCFPENGTRNKNEKNNLLKCSDSRKEPVGSSPSIGKSGDREGSRDKGAPQKRYKDMSWQELQEVLIAAGGKQENIKDHGAWLRYWKAAGGASGKKPPGHPAGGDPGA